MSEYRLTSSPGIVLRTSDGAFITEGHRWWDDYKDWLGNGNVPDPAQTDEEARAEMASLFEQAIQAHLDAAARARGYDSIATAVSYAEEPAVPRFQDDGRAFRAWRSLVWAYAYEQLALVKASKRPVPTLDAFLTEMPTLGEPATS